MFVRVLNTPLISFLYLLYLRDLTRKLQAAKSFAWLLINTWGFVQVINPAIVMGVPNEYLLKLKIYGNKIQQERFCPSSL